MALPRLSPGVGGPSARLEEPATDESQPDTDGAEIREVPIPVPPDVSEDEVEDAAEAAEEALPEDTEAVVGERETGPPDPDGPDEPQRTIEQLRKTGDPNEVQRTPVLDSGDIDVAPDEWELGFPLQGVPRIAAVVNLNYVYSDTRDRWERQTPSTGGTTVQNDVELLQETDMAGVDTIDIGDVITEDFGFYEVVLSYVSVTSDRRIVMQMRQDGSSSYDTNTSNYESGQGISQSIGVEVTDLIDPTSVVRLNIYDPKDPSNPTGVEGRQVESFLGQNRAVNARYLPDASVDGIRIRGSDSGSLVNFTNGTLRVYGKKRR